MKSRYSITVKYNGEAQAMKDAAGNTVYPVLYEGTTYLPIRAVSNMLGVGVDWDGATQTVLLNNEGNTAADDGNVIISPDKKTIDQFLDKLGAPGIVIPTMNTIIIDNPTVEKIREIMTERRWSETDIEAAVAAFEKTGPNRNDGSFFHQFSVKKEYTFKTSEDAKILENKHIANDYVEVDCSTASDGYVRVKPTKQAGEIVVCSIDGANAADKIEDFMLKPGQWANIPLLGKSDYSVSIFHGT